MPKKPTNPPIGEWTDEELAEGKARQERPNVKWRPSGRDSAQIINNEIAKRTKKKNGA